MTIDALTQFAEGYAFVAYALLFVGMLLEGELVMLFGGVLAQIGALDLGVVLAISFAGAVIKSLLWYRFGSFLGRLYSKGKFLCYLEKRVLFLFPNVQERPFWSIFVSKFIYGINHFTLILAGCLKIDFKKYFRAEFLSSTLWVTAVVGLGYFFSHSALKYTKELHKFSIIILLCIIAFILLERLLTFLITLVRETKQK